MLLLLSHLSICQFKLLNLHYSAAIFFIVSSCSGSVSSVVLWVLVLKWWPLLLSYWARERVNWLEYMVGVMIHLFGQSTMAFYGWIFHRLTCQRKLLITWIRWVQEYQMWSLGILQYNTKQRFGYPHDEDHQMYQMMKITKHQPCSLK